ncbi:hypothetical protein, partial [uncultured Lentibacter sp.]|uniref:hypothetical protein n=1 Tax=uncultured Lentibacter sp. TaxID=1659309 RepID=UPI002638BF7B
MDIPVQKKILTRTISSFCGPNDSPHSYLPPQDGLWLEISPLAVIAEPEYNIACAPAQRHNSRVKIMFAPNLAPIPELYVSYDSAQKMKVEAAD